MYENGLKMHKNYNAHFLTRTENPFYFKMWLLFCLFETIVFGGLVISRVYHGIALLFAGVRVICGILVSSRLSRDSVVTPAGGQHAKSFAKLFKNGSFLALKSNKMD